MIGVSRLVAFLITFCMGFGLAAGIFIGVPAAIIASYSLRDLENTNLISIPDEEFIRPDAKVDIFDLNGIELYDEYNELLKFGDDLNLNVIQDRYGLIFHEKLDLLLSDDVRTMPLKELLSMDGVHAVLKTVYIGNVEQYDCLNADGTPGGDPAVEGSYWVTKEGKRISELEQIIANFNLDDFISGNINTDVILHGNLVLADILGYTYDEENQHWIDSEGKKISGVMAVFADCTLDTVDDKINDTEIGLLLNYRKGDDGSWYETDDEGNEKVVHSFMDAVASEKISTLGGLFETITVGQIIPIEDRETGLLSIIPADTTIDKIGSAVNESVSNTPLQFFINQDLVSFEGVDDKLDKLSHKDENPIYDKDLVQFILLVNEGEDGYEDFLESKKYYGAEGRVVWSEVTDSNGNVVGYEVETWRTKLLSNSFAYIIKLMSGEATE